MTRNIINRAALTTALGLSTLAAAPAAAAPNTGARIATDLAREVVSATLGEGVAQAFSAALGANDTTSVAMDLSESAYDRIAAIVSQAVSDSSFDTARAYATDALNTARTYAVVQVGGVVATQAMADQQTLAKVNRVIDKAGLAETLMVSAGLRGLPLYTTVQAAALSALAELTRLQGAANEVSNLNTMNDVGGRSIAHIDAMVAQFQSDARTKWGISRHRTRTGSCHWLTGQCSKAWYQQCYTGPQGFNCGYEYRDDHAIGNSNGQQDNTWFAYWDAYRKRSADIATANAETFGNIGKVRAGIAARADFPDRFANPAAASGTFFDITRGWTDNSIYKRIVGDVNGDGLDDVVGFGHGGISVYVGDGAGGLSHAPSFDYTGAMYTYPTWGAEHPRFIADYNGDGYDDIVGFAGDGVFVSLSNGSAFGGMVHRLWNCGYNQGWRIGQHVREVADINGDGRADVMCINDAGVHVALNVNGNELSALELATTGMTLNNGGWTVASHPRMLADVNGDGMADLVGFGGGAVFVALSNGRTFDSMVANGIGFTISSGWQVGSHPRHMADVNGDGNADVVGFAGGGTHVSLSNGDGTFSAATQWYTGGGVNHGWGVNRHFRAFGDLDGDGAADLLLSGEGAGVSVVFASRP